MSLLSIGSEFVYEYPPSMYSTETMVHKWTYRVVAHDKVKGGLANRLEPLHCEKLYPVRMTLHRDMSYEVHETSKTSPDNVSIKLA